MHNSSLLIDPQGQLASRYDKLHLFGFCTGQEQYDEAATMTPGREVVSHPLPWGVLRLGICYDLRFPELFRLGPAPDFIALPAAFTHTTGLAHWALLLRARAVENLAFVFASAQGGHHPGGRRTFGHSMIIDPWGRILACRGGSGHGHRHPGSGSTAHGAQPVAGPHPSQDSRRPLRPAPFSTLGMTPHFKGLTMKLNTLMMLMALATAGQAAAKPLVIATDATYPPSRWSTAAASSAASRSISPMPCARP